MITEQNSLILAHLIFQDILLLHSYTTIHTHTCTQRYFPKIIVVFIINLTLNGLHLLGNFLIMN